MQINWLITTALTLVLSTGATKEKHLSYNNDLYHVLSLLVLVHRKCILISACASLLTCKEEQY